MFTIKNLGPEINEWLYGQTNVHIQPSKAKQRIAFDCKSEAKYIQNHFLPYAFLIHKGHCVQT